MSDIERARALLESEGYTCVLCLGDEFECSRRRGVAPLAALVDSGKDYSGWSAADKVVGRATAFLYALLGVRAVSAGVISRGALEVLRVAGIYVEYGTLADHIINRTGDGMCPFEAAVQSVDEPQEAYKVIRGKMLQMGIDI